MEAAADSSLMHEFIAVYLTVTTLTQRQLAGGHGGKTTSDSSSEHFTL
jgi:hypothetical protein